MQLTLKYFHDFGESKDQLGDNLNTHRAWDVLRTKAGVEGQYYIPNDRQTWQDISENNDTLNAKAKVIVQILNNEGNSVCSFGVGAAYLEYLIKKETPTLSIKCSDFAPQGLERLKKVFIEAEDIFQFDMLNDNWNIIEPENVCLFYRVDTVFDDEQWRDVFKKMRHVGIKCILFVPSDILTLPKILYFKFKFAIFKIIGRKMTFSGYLRTKHRLMSLMDQYYDVDEVDITGLSGFLMKIK